MEQWVGASWTEMGKVAVTTLSIYATTVIGLRLAGRRTVSQMSAFDFVVTIAIGSLVAATALSSDSRYGHGLAALLTLLAAQQIVALIRQRIPVTRRVLDFAPEPLYSHGEMNLRQNPLTAQLTETELYSKLRHQGIRSFDEVKVVILEPDGGISILSSDETSELWQRAQR